MTPDVHGRNSLAALFERCVRSNPQRIAIEHRSTQWTYERLSTRVDEIARGILAHGAVTPSYVGVHLQPSVDLVATLLAVLKVGSAYVPIDPSVPVERLRFIVSDANLRLLISNDEQLHDGNICRTHQLIEAGRLTDETVTFPSVAFTTDAYVIYTSGSSGKPKGVLCTHGNVLRLFESTEENFGFSARDRWTLFHSAAFDFSVWEIFGALLYGGTLIIVDPDVARDTEAFMRLLIEQHVTVLNQTPSAFYNLIRVAELRSAKFSSDLRFVILGGERLQLGKVRRWFDNELAPQAKLLNMYGITETTVHVTYREIAKADIDAHPHLSPIGSPIRDLAIYLLDENLQLVPDGEAGEICVAGPGVARGYLHRPDLTAVRFVPNPHDSGRRSLLYRSGDLGKRLASGELLYLGRIDRQVKIRGYRIEVGEIESALLAMPGACGACVVATPSGEDGSQLVAYAIPDAKAYPGAFLEADLRYRRTMSFLSLDSTLEVAYLNRAETLFMYNEIFKDRRYARLGLRLAPGACVVDVGANIGMFSLFVLRACPDAKLIAVEPIPDCAKVLKANLERYGARASVHSLALSDHSGSTRFRYFHHASVMSGQYAGSDEAAAMAAYLANKYERSVVAASLGESGLNKLIQSKLEYSDISCPLETLSSLIDREGLTRIDLLKIDVEKSELDVLKGIREDHWPLIDQIVVEIHDIEGRFDEIRSLLRTRGYSCRVDHDALLRGTGLSNVYAYREEVARTAGRARLSGAPHARLSQYATLVRQLRATVTDQLPDYMIPNQFHLVPEFPTTVNGKIDEQRLLALTPSRDRVSRTPRDHIEQGVRDIWLDALRLREVDLDIGLGDVGADSLAITMLSMHLQKTFNIDISVNELTDEASVASVANKIRHLAGHSPSVG